MNDLVDAMAVAASKGPFPLPSAAVPTVEDQAPQGSLFDD